MASKSIKTNSEGETEYLEKFGYREYEGIRTSRLRRILSIVEFEVRSTWSRSTFGKVLLVILMVMNFFTILFSSGLADSFQSGYPGGRQAYIDDALHSFIATYISFNDAGYIIAGPEYQSFGGPNLGFLLIALFAIAGSGLFADDKNGKVIEIYLSRITKKEYIIGKVGAILTYINLFLMIPLIVVVTLMLQSWGEPQFQYWELYLRIIWFSFLYSLVIGMIILFLSSILEKRNYASLAFFLIYMVGSIFSQRAIESNTSNEFLILLSPDYFLGLLAYVALGDYQLGFGGGFDFETGDFRSSKLLDLNDGTGLEYWHIYGIAFAVIALFASLLSWKINRLTTEEL
ncbi:MAG: ABC transporter permease subunit [Candidatus Heimdallarchaeota archaeon]|nr:ABC transporter permease subunit [Candidatus Heimdallarchaeota archaeon]